MAGNSLKTRIQLRNDEAATWVKKNPVLLAGEMGIEVDTGKIKIGNGAKAWNELSYSGVDENGIKSIINSNRDKVSVLTLTEGKTDADMLATIAAPVQGDMAVVENTFVEGKTSRTAYFYDGTNWAAFDGNYSADNVYFDEDITYTVGFGTLAKPASNAKFAATGKNVTEVFKTLMATEQNPSKTEPAVSFSAEGGFGTFEIGTKRNLTYTATLSTGGYTYGPATGITAQSWSVSCTGVADKLTTATGSFENVVAEITAKKITATATYGDGAVPVTNLDKAYPAAKIVGGSKSKDSSTLVGVRYMFWGPVTSDVELNSANIRGLKNNKATETGALTTFGAGAGAKKVIVAVPAGRKITEVLMPSALNADVTALFVKQGTQVDVEGANGYTAAKYDVYVYQPASIDAGETYAVTIG